LPSRQELMDALLKNTFDRLGQMQPATSLDQIYQGIIPKQGIPRVPQGNTALAAINQAAPSGPQYFPNDGSYGYNASNGAYEPRQSGNAYSVGTLPPNAPVSLPSAPVAPPGLVPAGVVPQGDPSLPAGLPRYSKPGMFAAPVPAQPSSLMQAMRQNAPRPPQRSLMSRIGSRDLGYIKPQNGLSREATHAALLAQQKR